MDDTNAARLNLIFVNILTPDTALYKGYAKSVTSKNVRGTFDVLYFHTNFVSIIKEFIKVQETDGTFKNFPIESAIIKVLNNKVHIFIGIDTLQEK
jgi:F0F1-type ATP synthase epsilon subunit